MNKESSGPSKRSSTSTCASASAELFVVSTPIGNLGDMTARAIEVLRVSDYAYSEDTRVSRKLFNHFGIDTKLRRFDDRTSTRKIPEILELLATGHSVSLVSDAGTPVISDPGMPLVDAAIDAGFQVTAIPGASAAVTALSISGLPAHAYYFGGFLPRKKGKRANLIADLSKLNATLIFYESPHRIVEVLEQLASIYPDRLAAVARELTKRHEELVRASLQELAAEFAQRKAAATVGSVNTTAEAETTSKSLKGEFVILIAPLPAASEAGHVDKYADKKTAANS